MTASNTLRLQRDFRQPEVEKLGVPTLGDEDVRWLDVPVNDSLGGN
jgi:hypothetical protein